MRFLLAHISSPGRVLEIGSGNGKVLRTLARYRSSLELHGCDIRKPYSTPDSYTFHLMSSDIPVPAGSFDTVLIFDVLEHVPDPAFLVDEAARVLRPGGRLLACVPVEGEKFSFYELFRRLCGRDTYAITKEHIQAFTHAELRSLLARRFQMREAKYAYHTFGQLMDAAFFAFARLPLVRRFWWEKNAFYNPEQGHSSGATGLANRMLKAANAVAWAESSALERCRFSSAAVLVDAEVLNDPK